MRNLPSRLQPHWPGAQTARRGSEPHGEHTCSRARACGRAHTTGHRRTSSSAAAAAISRSHAHHHSRVRPRLLPALLLVATPQVSCHYPQRAPTWNPGVLSVVRARRSDGALLNYAVAKGNARAGDTGCGGCGLQRASPPCHITDSRTYATRDADTRHHYGHCRSGILGLGGGKLRHQQIFRPGRGQLFHGVGIQRWTVQEGIRKQPSGFSAVVYLRQLRIRCPELYSWARPNLQ